MPPGADFCQKDSTACARVVYYYKCFGYALAGSARFVKEEPTMQIRPMTLQDKDAVLPMVAALYQTPAVEHPAPDAIRERAFLDAVGENPHVQGFLLEENGQPAGFAYLTYFYSCEAAGNVVMLEEFFVKDSCRSKGLGRQFLDWLYAAYPDAVRFRLDITRGNPAAHLYERCGFRFLDCDQMAFDR